MNSASSSDPYGAPAYSLAKRASADSSSDILQRQIDQEYRELWKYFGSQSYSAERQYFTNETYAVRILELFILTGIIAIGLTLIRNFGIAGSLAVFLMASLFSMVSSWLTFDANRVRFWNQIWWGGIVPVAAVVGDPFVFGTFERGVPTSLKSVCAGTYFVLIYSILLLGLGWILKPTSYPWANTLLAGQLAGSSFIMVLIGVVLLPVSLIGLFSLFGLIGLVPFFAGAIYFRTSAMHHRWAKSKAGSTMRSTFVIGFALMLFAFVVLSTLGVDRMLMQSINQILEFWE